MKFLDMNGLTSVLSKLLTKVSAAFDGLEERVTANETAIEGKADAEHSHEDVNELVKELYVNNYDGSQYQLNMLTEFSGGITIDPGYSWAEFYECANGDVYMYGRFDAAEAYLSKNARTVYCLPGSFFYNGGFFSDDIKKVYCAKKVDLKDISDIFCNCTALEEVRLPPDLERIEINMFKNCTSLKSVEIPDTVTEILDGAFKGCTSLTEIKIPSSVISIYYDAFEGCANLSTIIIDGPQGSINDEEENTWGAPSAEIIWLG